MQFILDVMQVIFSDADVPGEGEHKIMDFIRSQRASHGYKPTMVACVCVCVCVCLYIYIYIYIYICVCVHVQSF
jgi:hypothetical protein